MKKFHNAHILLNENSSVSFNNFQVVDIFFKEDILVDTLENLSRISLSNLTLMKKLDNSYSFKVMHDTILKLNNELVKLKYQDMVFISKLEGFYTILCYRPNPIKRHKRTMRKQIINKYQNMRFLPSSEKRGIPLECL